MRRAGEQDSLVMWSWKDGSYHHSPEECANTSFTWLLTICKYFLLPYLSQKINGLGKETLAQSAKKLVKGRS